MADSLPRDVAVAIALSTKTRLGATKGERRPRKPAGRRGGPTGFGFPPDDREDEVSMAIGACAEYARATRQCLHSLRANSNPETCTLDGCLGIKVKRIDTYQYKPGPKPVGRGGKRDDDMDVVISEDAEP